MYTASFFGDEEQFPRYFVGENFLTQHAALLACEADLRREAMNGRKYYNALCYYEITEYNEEDERGDTVNAAELPPLTGANLGDWVRIVVLGKVRHGEIIAVEPRYERGYFVVSEFLKNGRLSHDQRRWHYLALSGLERVTVYQRFTLLDPTPEGKPWTRIRVPLEERKNQ